MSSTTSLLWINCGSRIIAVEQTSPLWVNSLKPSDPISRQRNWSSLVHEIAWCLTAPGHYLFQGCLIVNWNLTHYSEIWFTFFIKAVKMQPFFAGLGMLIKQYKQPRIKQHMLHTIVPASTYSIYLISYPTLALVQRIDYCQTTNIRRTKSQNLNVSRLVLRFSLPNPALMPCVQSRMKMSALLQLHLSDQQLYCLLRGDLY